jgi:hypothetical protein
MCGAVYGLDVRGLILGSGNFYSLRRSYLFRDPPSFFIRHTPEGTQPHLVPSFTEAWFLGSETSIGMLVRTNISRETNECYISPLNKLTLSSHNVRFNVLL